LLACTTGRPDPPFFGGPEQGTRQIIELVVAFGPTSLIGLEREIQGKSAGVRTQTIVGTAAALILLVSKYGFSDVVQDGLVVVDPSRVAAQIVSGIGFLGAGIIIFRRGSVHGLTTAAAVWESAAIGLAAGADALSDQEPLRVWPSACSQGRELGGFFSHFLRRRSWSATKPTANSTRRVTTMAVPTPTSSCSSRAPTGESNASVRPLQGACTVDGWVRKVRG
jgi:hypothetical protein